MANEENDITGALHYSSSPNSLSSPPSAFSDPSSPTKLLKRARANIEMDEIVVDPGSAQHLEAGQTAAPTLPNAPLTAAGLPRKKPGRKPGSTVKPRVATDGSSTNTDPPKQRRPRKPRDPNAPPVPRKRKTAANSADNASDPMDVDGPHPNPQHRFAGSVVAGSPPPHPLPPSTQVTPKREPIPGSMMSILNDDPPPRPQPTVAPAAPRPIFDPVRGNYDPVRETMVARAPYSTGNLGSPRAPTQVANRASASPSIASLVDPPPANTMSPAPSQHSHNNSASHPRPHEPNSSPPSPSHPARPAPRPAARPAAAEAKRAPPPPSTTAQPKTESTKHGFTPMTSIPSAATSSVVPALSAPLNKKAAAIQHERERPLKGSTASSASNAAAGLKESGPTSSGPNRSILDFGKANPGEELQAPSIVLNIPLNGETNKYVNFMRMAEERYGWDALHPRLAAHRERKARIAAASAALEKNGSGRESGDEMSVDLQSDGEGSNVEMGGMGNTAGGASGPESAPAKPARKKRNFKEDEYDKDDDFVDDSELLWEEQAAASRDGFFVYSGPLIPEVEKSGHGAEAPPKRGRGGRGSRGGARGSGTARGEGAGRGRGGGPGSRGGAAARKPRITKLEKEQRDREKAEREKLAQVASKSGAGAGPPSLLQLENGISQNDTAGVAS